MHRKYAQEKHTDTHVCKCVTVLHPTDDFEIILNCSEVSDDSIQRVPKRAEDSLHLLCIYCNARKVGCTADCWQHVSAEMGHRQVTHTLRITAL
jgi:hypothetical protein